MAKIIFILACVIAFIFAGITIGIVCLFNKNHKRLLNCLEDSYSLANQKDYVGQLMRYFLIVVAIDGFLMISMIILGFLAFNAKPPC